MSVQLNNDGTLSLTAMSLVEFLPEIESAIHNGYMLDLEKNEGVPQQYGSMLVLTMYPAGKIEVQEVDKKETVQVTPLFTESEQVPKENKPAEVKVDGRKKKV